MSRNIVPELGHAVSLSFRTKHQEFEIVCMSRICKGSEHGMDQDIKGKSVSDVSCSAKKHVF